MPRKSIFLASSAELREDRQAFRDMIVQVNEEWSQRGYEFVVRYWEDFIDAMSRDGLQKEYDQAARGCDIFVMLFFTKVGPYTQQEFDAAFAGMQAGSRPRIYTYFRNDHVLSGNIGDEVRSLLDFKSRLKALGHYVTLYNSSEDLQWRFSQQLNKLYGGERASSLEITATTAQAKLGEFALVLSHRQLFGDLDDEPVDAQRLAECVARSSVSVRGAIFHLARDLRRSTWAEDKHQMGRTLPVFEALVAADRSWHAPYGQLGFALKDQRVPDWQRARDMLDRAIELRGERVGEGLYYQYNRALCAINLDPAFALRRAADAPTREAIVDLLRRTRRELDIDWERIVQDPESADIRAWMLLNAVPKLR